MNRIGIVGLLVAFACAAFSCGGSGKKPLTVEARYQLTTPTTTGQCGVPRPNESYIAQDGHPVADGGPGLHASCYATKRSDGTYRFTLSSYVDEANGLAIDDLVIDPSTCDPVTHVCGVSSSSCRVTFDEDDGAGIFRFRGPCSASTPVPGACQVTAVELDSNDTEGKTIALHVACNTLETEPPTGRACDLKDSANVSMPAYLRFTGCTY